MGTVGWALSYKLYCINSFNHHSHLMRYGLSFPRGTEWLVTSPRFPAGERKKDLILGRLDGKLTHQIGRAEWGL